MSTSTAALGLAVASMSDTKPTLPFIQTTRGCFTQNLLAIDHITNRMTDRISIQLPHCGWAYGNRRTPQPFLITATNADGSADGYSNGNNQTIPAGEWLFELPAVDEDQVQWAELLGYQ